MRGHDISTSAETRPSRSACGDTKLRLPAAGPRLTIRRGSADSKCEHKLRSGKGGRLRKESIALGRRPDLGKLSL